MNDDINVVIEEKFTRCPRCRSFSVRQTDELTFDERIKAHFVPVIAYKCDNCEYRFVEFEKFTKIWGEKSKYYYDRIQRKWLLAVIPLCIVAIITAASILIPGNGRRPVKDDKKIEQKQAAQVQTENKKPVVLETKPVEEKFQPPVEEKKEPVVDILLGNSNRFGVNWVTVSNGVQIARMSEGPLKKAGLQIGDVFSEVDNQKITSNYLLKIRNEIVARQRNEALIKVYRDGVLLYYRLIKEKTDEKKEEKKDEKIEPVPIVKTGFIKVFSQTIIKIRSSAPNSVNAASKWRYDKNKVSIRREANQRVFIAGDSLGTKKWGVDDQLIINGKVYTGLIDTDYRSENSYIPDDVKNTPIDITDLAPAGQDVQLTFELADHGKFWGSTDIYIVIK